jgi:hypothetical protein
MRRPPPALGAAAVAATGTGQGGGQTDGVQGTGPGAGPGTGSGSTAGHYVCDTLLMVDAASLKAGKPQPPKKGEKYEGLN